MNEMVIADKFSRFILFLSVIQQILNADTIALSEFKYHKKISEVEGKRMQLVFDYMMKNFQNTIGLKDVAGLVYMMPNAFCRFFKQRTNKTFFQFLIQLRVAHACQMLENKTYLSIETIALSSDFNSVSNFNRQFKSLKKMAPSNYSRTLL
jgi:transcriptional regulator GlxA family with amidase domain